MLTTILVLLATMLGLLFAVKKAARPHNFPPGPRWIPLIGHVRLLRSLSSKLGAQHLALTQLARDFATPLLGLKLGGELVVVASSFAVVREVLRREEFEGRPDTFFIRLRSMGSRHGVTCTDGPFWREQRSFVVRHLRQLGFGKLSMEHKVAAELREMTSLLRAGGQAGVSLRDCLAPSVLNVIWALTAGCRFARQDEGLLRLLRLLAERGKAFDMAGGMLNQMPWLRFVAPEKTGYTLLLRVNHDLRQLFVKSISEHKENYSPEATTDLIDAFLHEMNAAKGKDSTFTEDQLVMVCLDLFLAGSQTTSNTLDFAFLMMLLHPEIQHRVHQEIDTVIGSQGIPTLSQQKSLPYTEAVLMEVQRLYQVTPIAGPRRTLRETTLRGYRIPKDATILINLWSIHMDKEHWGDPENFRPERFLNAAGELVLDDWLLPFGLGRRRCLGEALARSCIFIFFAGLMQQFKISAVPGQEVPSDIPNAGITLSAKPYEAVLTPRASQLTY